MKSIESKYFGDIYENSVIGQHSTWKKAYSAMWKLLLNDAVMLNLFNTEELRMVTDMGEFALTQLTVPYSASFSHGDLGSHNVLVDCSKGLRCIGTVIDFGNATFLPFYVNEDGIRRYGGWGLESIDVCEQYSICKTEYHLNNLLFDFENSIFSSMLELRRGNDPKQRISRFLENCRQNL